MMNLQFLFVFSQCMQQKVEAEKKLSNFTFQEGCSSDNNILVKHLQEELRSYVSYVIICDSW